MNWGLYRTIWSDQVSLDWIEEFLIWGPAVDRRIFAKSIFNTVLVNEEYTSQVHQDRVYMRTVLLSTKIQLEGTIHYSEI